MMMLDDLIAKFPNLDIGNFAMFESSYQCFFNAVYGQNSYDDEAILWLVAHLITASMSTTSNQITSESVDGVSVSYSSEPSSQYQSFLNSTVYGQMFLMLRNSPRTYQV